MDPLLVEHVQRDPRRIHFDPKRKEALVSKYALVEEPDALAFDLAAE
jgi:hypothetical protein